MFTASSGQCSGWRGHTCHEAVQAVKAFLRQASAYERNPALELWVGPSSAVEGTQGPVGGQDSWSPRVVACQVGLTTSSRPSEEEARTADQQDSKLLGVPLTLPRRLSRVNITELLVAAEHTATFRP